MDMMKELVLTTDSGKTVVHRYITKSVDEIPMGIARWQGRLFTYSKMDSATGNIYYDESSVTDVG